MTGMAGLRLQEQEPIAEGHHHDRCYSRTRVRATAESRGFFVQQSPHRKLVVTIAESRSRATNVRLAVNRTTFIRLAALTIANHRGRGKSNVERRKVSKMAKATPSRWILVGIDLHPREAFPGEKRGEREAEFTTICFRLPLCPRIKLRLELMRNRRQRG